MEKMNNNKNHITENSSKNRDWNDDTKDKYADIIRSMNEHENDLLNMRFTWLMTIQGLLFASLGFTLDEKNLLIIIIICIMGIITAVSFISVRKIWKAALRTLNLWRKENLKDYKGPPQIGLEESNKMTITSLFYPWYIFPWAFIVSWLVILIYCVLTMNFSY